MSLSILFAGTPTFSAVVLEGLIRSSYQVKAVYTQPDRPAGRGRQMTRSAVKQMALQYDLPVFQPVTLRDEKEQSILANLHADIMVVVAYGLILPKAVLDIPPLGCVNIHASLLPRWRGAAPIQRAILSGDSETGITIMQMNEGLDKGPMLFQSRCPIHDQDTSESLYHRLSIMGADALFTVLNQIHHLKPEEQNDAGATYANKILKEEATIDWTQSAEAISRQVRAFQPWPVAQTRCGDVFLRIWEATVIEQPALGAPGEIMQTSKDGIDVATGNHRLRLTKIQFPGRKVLDAADVFHARHKDLSLASRLG